MTKPSENQLRDAVKRMEGRIKVLETIQAAHNAKLEECETRLQKVEVVRVPSPTTAEQEPDYPQRPETE